MAGSATRSRGLAPGRGGLVDAYIETPGGRLFGPLPPVVIAVNGVASRAEVMHLAGGPGRPVVGRDWEAIGESARAGGSARLVAPDDERGPRRGHRGRPSKPGRYGRRRRDRRIRERSRWEQDGPSF